MAGQTVHARQTARALFPKHVARVILATLLLLSLAAVVGVSLLSTRQEPPSMHPIAEATSSQVATSQLLEARLPTPPQTVVANTQTTGPTLTPNGSLEGTEVDGALKLDGNGRIVLDVDLRRLFDYLLARSGEMSEEQLRHWSEQELAKRYPAHADALVAIFRRYLLLRERMANVSKTDSLALDLAQLSALRREVLGAEMAAAFFADDEALAQFALARQQLQTSVMTPEQRRANELALLDTLPEHLRAGWEDLLQQEAISTATERGDIHAQEALLDPAARRRLEQLAIERAGFEQRVRDYLKARAQVTDEATRAALRARWLRPEERERVAALEAIGQEQSLFTPAPSGQ